MTRKKKLNLNKPSLETLRNFAADLEQSTKERLNGIEEEVRENKNLILMLAGVFVIGILIGAATSRKRE